MGRRMHMMKMKKSTVGVRAWNRVRVALLWARKGSHGMFKNRLHLMAMDLPKFLNRHSHDPCALHYGERQFSFGDTPIIHVKMHRPASLRFKLPHIPCISNPSVVDFEESDFDCDEMISYGYDDNRKCSSSSFIEDDYDEEESEGIDVKAEEFIAKFYQQMKLQRQISYLQYNETLARGAN